MAALLSKTNIIAIEEEGSGYGTGPTNDHIVTAAAITFGTPISLTINSGITNGVVSEPSIKVYLDTGTTSGSVDAGDTLLTLDTDYTITTTSTETVVTPISGSTILSGGEDLVITYGVFEDPDVLQLDVGSYMDSSIEEITPNVANGQYLTCPSVAGQETSSATFTFDLKMEETQVAPSVGKLVNHKVIKNALGYYLAGGATVDKVAQTIVDSGTESGGNGYDLYRFSKVGEATASLAARQYLGASAAATEDYFGIMTEGVTMNMNTADLIKFDIPVQGIDFHTISETFGDPSALSGLPCGTTGFVGKRATFKLYGNSLDVTNLSLNPGNTLRDSNSITSTGIYRKTITEKMFEGSFDFEIEDTTILKDFKDNVSGSVYFELANTEGDEIIIYLPNLRITNVGRTDDAGVIVQNTTFKAFMDANNNALYIATKKAV